MLRIIWHSAVYYNFTTIRKLTGTITPKWLALPKSLPHYCKSQAIYYFIASLKLPEGGCYNGILPVISFLDVNTQSENTIKY